MRLVRLLPVEVGRRHVAAEPAGAARPAGPGRPDHLHRHPGGCATARRGSRPPGRSIPGTRRRAPGGAGGRDHVGVRRGAHVEGLRDVQLGAVHRPVVGHRRRRRQRLVALAGGRAERRRRRAARPSRRSGRRRCRAGAGPEHAGDEQHRQQNRRPRIPSPPTAATPTQSHRPPVRHWRLASRSIPGRGKQAIHFSGGVIADHRPQHPGRGLRAPRRRGARHRGRPRTGCTWTSWTTISSRI